MLSSGVCEGGRAIALNFELLALARRCRGRENSACNVCVINDELRQDDGIDPIELAVVYVMYAPSDDAVRTQRRSPRRAMTRMVERDGC